VYNGSSTNDPHPLLAVVYAPPTAGFMKTNIDFAPALRWDYCWPWPRRPCIGQRRPTQGLAVLLQFVIAIANAGWITTRQQRSHIARGFPSPVRN